MEPYRIPDLTGSQSDAWLLIIVLYAKTILKIILISTTNMARQNVCLFVWTISDCLMLFPFLYMCIYTYVFHAYDVNSATFLLLLSSDIIFVCSKTAYFSYHVCNLKYLKIIWRFVHLNECSILHVHFGLKTIASQDHTTPFICVVLEMTVGHRTFSDQIWALSDHLTNCSDKMSDQFFEILQSCPTFTYVYSFQDKIYKCLPKSTLVWHYVLAYISSYFKHCLCIKISVFAFVGYCSVGF